MEAQVVDIYHDISFLMETLVSKLGLFEEDKGSYLEIGLEGKLIDNEDP